MKQAWSNSSINGMADPWNLQYIHVAKRRPNKNVEPASIM